MHGRPACSYEKRALQVSRAQLRLKLLWLKEDDELALKVCMLVTESLPCIFMVAHKVTLLRCPITVRLRGKSRYENSVGNSIGFYNQQT